MKSVHGCLKQKPLSLFLLWHWTYEYSPMAYSPCVCICWSVLVLQINVVCCTDSLSRVFKALFNPVDNWVTRVPNVRLTTFTYDVWPASGTGYFFGLKADWWRCTKYFLHDYRFRQWLGGSIAFITHAGHCTEINSVCHAYIRQYNNRVCRNINKSWNVVYKNIWQRKFYRIIGLLTWRDIHC
jgi:hypothetical protein